MDPIVLLPYVGGALAMFFAASLQRRRGRARLRAWRSVAERVGLRVTDMGVTLYRPAWLEARAEGRKVRFEHRPAGKRVSYTWMTVETGSGLTLRHEQPGKSLLTQDLLALGRREEREIELGDAAFDAAVEVHGPAERIRALLDAETRAVVLGMLGGRLPVAERPAMTIQGRVELSDGELRAVLDEQPSPPLPQELRDALVALFALAERFRAPADVAARLADTVAREPVWQVRLQGLRLLATSFPDHAATLPALRRALADEHPEVALDAALLLGEEGTEQLLGVARSAEVDDATAARAVHALGDLLPAELGVPLLRQSLRLRRIATATACLHALAGVPDAEVGDLLAQVVARERGVLAVEAARAMRRREGGDTEATLLRALARPEPDLVLAAVEALGHTGTAHAVPALREAAERDGAGAELRRAVRQAVAAIQSRLQGSPGQLSIAEGEAGRLSLAGEDPRGRVSLPGGAGGTGAGSAG